MAGKRAYDPYQTLRVGLPAVVIAALGAGAIYLAAPAHGPAASDAELLTTGEVQTSEQAVDSAPVLASTVSGAAPSECGPVNGFIITIVAGEPDCGTIEQVAGPYTQAVLGDELGRALMWSGNGWSCIRNFDETGVVANSHGLICQGDGAFLLYYSEG